MESTQGTEETQVIFFSPHGAYRITDENTKIHDRIVIVQFKAVRGGYMSPGAYSTKDPAYIEYLRKHPAYGKSFSDKPKFKALIPGFSRDDILKDVRSSATSVQNIDAKIAAATEEARAFGKAEAENEFKLKSAGLVEQYAALNRSITTEDGKIKVGTKKADIDRLKELKAKLGLEKE